MRIILPVWLMLIAPFVAFASGGGSAINRLPEPVNDSIIVVSGSTITIDPTQNDSDPDNDSIWVLGFTVPDHGSNSFVGSQVTYQSNPGYIGSDRFTYTVVDNQGMAASATVNITVLPLKARPHPAPVARRDEIALPENRPSVINASANDALQLLPLNVTLSFTNPPEANVSQGNQAGSIFCSPSVPAPRQFEFSYAISDSFFQSSTSSAFVTISRAEFNISGQVRDAFGQGISNESVILNSDYNRVVKTGANGRYAFTGLPAGGNFTVKALGVQGFFFAPAVRTYNNLQSDQSNQDFQAQPTYTLTAEVRDSMSNEAVPGRTVELLSGGVVIATLVTDTNGLAVFGNTGAGLAGNQEYTLRPVKDGTDVSPEEVNIYLVQNDLVTFSTSTPLSLFSFGASSYSLTETGKVLVTVVRTGDTNDSASVRVVPLPGTATRGSDFVLPESFFDSQGAVTVLFAPGETSKTVTVSGVDDAFTESEETFTLRLSNPSTGSVLGSPPTALITITDDDSALPTVSFVEMEAFTYENAVTVTVTLQRTGDINQTLLVGTFIDGGTAEREKDFSSAFAGTQFNPGQATIPVTFNITNDMMAEGLEFFRVRLDSSILPGHDYVVGSNPVVTISISDETQPVVEWVEASRYAQEGDGKIALPAKRTGDLSRALDVPVTLSSAISNLEATNDVILPPPYLYNSPSQVLLHFGEGEQFASLIVTIVSNAMSEPFETGGFVILPGPQHTVGSQNVSYLYVVDQDGPGTIVFERPELTVSEGAGPARLTLRRYGRLSDSLTVQLVSGTIVSNAAGPADFTFGNTVSFPPGATTATTPLTITDDLLIEEDEGMLISINNVTPAGEIGQPHTMQITIRDNDGPPGLRFTQPNFDLARGLPSPGGVGFERVGPSQTGLTLQPQVTGGTATGAEFGLSTSPLTVPPNVSVGVLPITVFTNVCTSSTSTISVSITGEVVSPSMGVVNLSVSPCPEPQEFNFVATSSSFRESIGAAPIFVARYGDTSQADTVWMTVTGGTATEFSDFSLPSTVAIFPPGVKSVSLPVTIVQDTSVEPGETFVLTLNTPSRGTVGTNSSFIGLIIDDDNGAALARDDSVLVPAGSNLTFTVTINDLPFDTNGLIVVSNSTALFGSCVITSNGVATYTPSPGVTQAFETIQYDVRGLTSSIASTGLIAITILPQPPNHPPTVADDSAIVVEGGVVILNVVTNDSDADGDALSVNSFSQPPQGTVSRTGVAGELRYDAPIGFTGVDTFFCTVSDGRGGLVIQQVRIGVHPAGPGNRAPFAFDDAVRVCRPFAIFNPLLNDRDPDGDALSVDAIILNPTKGQLVALGGGNYKYTPFAGQVGADSMTYRIKDSNNAQSGLAVVRFTLNQRPNAVTDLLATPKDKALVTDLLANDTDPDNDVLNLIAVSPARFGNVAVIAAVPGQAQVRYTPPPGFTGVDTFTYKVSDGCDTVTGVARVKVNHPPVAVNDYASVQPGGRVNLRPMANDFDPEGGPLKLVRVNPPRAGIMVQAGNVVTYIAPESGFVGTDRFDYTIQDDGGSEATGTIFVGNEPFNNPPTANDDHFNLDLAITNALDAPVLANDFDVDADWISVVAFSGAINGTATNVGGTMLRYTPNAGFSGIEKIAYTITDGRGGVDAAYLVITVCPTNNPGNQPPTAVSDATSVDTFNFVDIPVLANDLDLDGPTTNLVSAGTAAEGTVVIIGNQIRYTPNSGFIGIDCFTYTVSDGAGNSAGGLVTVRVLPFPLPANTPPAASNDVVFALPNSVAFIEPLVNDADADLDPLTIVSFTGPTNGMVLPAGAGRLLYKPVLGFAGSDTINYTISDGRGGSASATIQITVPGLFSAGQVTENGTNFFQIVLPPYDPPLTLESTTNLNAPIIWNFITNTPAPPSAPLVLKFPFDLPERYFRLVP